MCVIYAAIYSSIDIMKELETNYIFLKLDQAMFIMEHEGSSVFDEAILRMGGFHIVLIIHNTIFSRFKNAGIVELLSAAGHGGR